MIFNLQAILLLGPLFSFSTATSVVDHSTDPCSFMIGNGIVPITLGTVGDKVSCQTNACSRSEPPQCQFLECQKLNTSKTAWKGPKGPKGGPNSKNIIRRGDWVCQRTGFKQITTI